MTIDKIERTIREFSEAGKKMFATSSFQTHSIPLLHIISQIDSTIPVYFINTGFLFAETVAYKNEIADRLQLNILDTTPVVTKAEQKDRMGRFFFASDPDHCCFLNKVQPLEPVIAKHDVWINGVRADQTDVRKSFKDIEQVRSNFVRFHPMLDWTKQDIYRYIRENNLPRHPLDMLGYSSIGCEPCTHKPRFDDDERNSRWFGLKKTECGLNTTLINKEESR
ncbi:phosphoadenylyl-sulfate reductase [Alistipes sp. ZOR0009]|jgi:phosphoadenosine phosphosulfate reductase|uniref:phosphoadenylyl-sulfate reductase n=1 Tax=Alistipes sp. ZOR0009 TaxID=1339253 RepID=UPI00064579D3|nr:phosphoadenylyl-sulfate reductase [Alistipes sp. ZOR0009]